MKKGAVDVALMIGAIVIPTAALIGSLILAFSMIERLTDAMLVATVVAHDISALTAVAYSMPEDITIYHNPPFDCRYIYDEGYGEWYLSCLSDEMNITLLHRRVFTKTSRTFRYVSDPVNYFAHTAFRIDIPTEDIVVRNFPFSTYATFKEGGILYYDIKEEGLEISKTRRGFQDSLSGETEEDSFFEIIKIVHDVCRTKEDGEEIVGTVRLPPPYYICAELWGELKGELKLDKFIFSPNKVTPPYSRDGITPQKYVLEEYGECVTLHKFNVNNFENLMGCKVEINLFGTHVTPEYLECSSLRANDVFRVGGYLEGDEKYSRNFDIVRYGIQIEYNVTYSESDDSESDDKVTLSLLRVG